MTKDKAGAGLLQQLGAALLGVAMMCVPSFLYSVPAMWALLPLLPWLMVLGSEGMELTRKSGHRLHDTFCMALALSAIFCATYPASLSGKTWVAAVWIAMCFGVGITQTEQPKWRVIKWASLSLAGVLIAAVLLLIGYKGRIVPGLAADVTGAVGRSEHCESILLTAYRAGYMALDGNLAILPAVQIGDAIVMTDEVRNQLLNGMQTTLEYALESLLPVLCVWWIGLTVFFGTVMPNVRMRRRGETQHLLPPFDRWHIPRGHGIRIGSLGLGALIPYLTDQPVWRAFGQMCSATFSMAFFLQGVCTLHFVAKKSGMGKGARWAWSVALTVLFPAVLVLAGVVDQATTLRGLRETNEKEEQ